MEVTRRDAQTLLKVLQRLLKLPLVLRDVTKDMKCIRLLRLTPQHIKAYSGRLIALACLVQLKRLLQK